MTRWWGHTMWVTRHRPGIVWFEELSLPLKERTPKISCQISRMWGRNQSCLTPLSSHTSKTALGSLSQKQNPCIWQNTIYMESAMILCWVCVSSKVKKSKNNQLTCQRNLHLQACWGYSGSLSYLFLRPYSYGHQIQSGHMPTKSEDYIARHNSKSWN